MLGNKLKTQNAKRKVKVQNLKLLVLSFSFTLFVLRLALICFANDAQQGFIYDARGKRDPFIPLLTSDGRLLKLDIEEDVSDIIIEGILFDADGLSYAIVNGATVGVGDEIKGYRVLKIEKDEVAFIKDGQISEIEYKKEGN